VTDSTITEDIKAFIRSHFHSVSTLEVFLLLIEDLGKAYTPTEVSTKLRSNSVYAEDQLWDLVRAGLVTPVDEASARFKAVGDNAHLEMFVRLRQLYQTSRTSIINIIYSRPEEPIQGLADAFVFKKGNA
jgi:hypothetical protein